MLSANVTFFSEVQSMNTQPANLTRLSGRTTLSSFEQPQNAYSPISSTLFPMLISVREEQSLKTEFPICFTLFGRVTLFNDVQSLKANSSMYATLQPMVTLPIAVQPLKA